MTFEGSVRRIAGTFRSQSAAPKNICFNPLQTLLKWSTFTAVVLELRLEPKQIPQALPGPKPRGVFAFLATMKFPQPMESRMYGDPSKVVEERQNREANAAKRRQREEAMVDVMSAQKLRTVAKPVEVRRAHKPLAEFLAEEDGPKEWSPARRAAEALFK
ncbi:hypothetical protein NDK50_07985 [Paraburkholderia bryophila]|uniref:hypothetical protein n=1 Tax=Paraburkholderia bryophila TaxID=420952 RepID=UPI00234944CB|nr:hypothetical protein [Paraburkholderia bryophila]WCM21375.1 hypothetical protein NDK50_07985 [Paraburkholderia bryophila]